MSFKEDINITLENLYKKNKNQKKDVFKKILLSFLKDNIRTIFEKVKTDIKLSNSELSFLKFVLVEPKFIVDTNTIYDKFKNVIESQKTESADITKKKDRLTYSDLTSLKFALVDTECANYFKENWEQNESDIIKKIYGKILNEDKIERYEISFFETIWEAGYTGFFKKIWNQDEYNFVDRIKEKVINGEELTENEILYFKWGNIYGDMDAFKVVWESGQMELKGRIEKKINSHIRCTKDEILFLRAGAKMGDHDSFWMIGLSYQDSCQKEINAHNSLGALWRYPAEYSGRILKPLRATV